MECSSAILPDRKSRRHGGNLPKGKEKNMGDNTYLRNLALTTMSKLGIKAVGLSDGETSHDLYVRNEFAMKYLLRKMRPETLGRIIASAKPVKPGSRKMSIKDVNPWPSLDRGGMEILYDFACATIVAEMMDIIMARRSKDRIGDDVQSDDLINHMSTGNSSEHDIPL
ncbi:MAG: hypothetical protein A3A28_03965 [Candidatus Sungbacteria bacterium RIFCSPLOWO2_01_FULL_47_32]|uniref:Uncharacterized protein n=1 Tax=Candidatus Sungbacteria bacterium RIFCSPHIGHO2_01_FULL_47_32 TaxID=1802264 RepID=A0A1G2K1X2_9BACT|nr:MAG: hypothetical protein A2633_01615 [Candidatus Sungbacteria bacterium RIFCSPHIGHO2_01_FULL_47_32]OHA05064.1 MAG: hypothetical protein A3A28_03965 [Candidatus Sungbacteria bacterium RIFCSPLOWO2_01_FULL_47_32]